MHRQDGPRRAGRRLRAELRSCACRSSPTTRRSTARDARVTRRSAAFVWRLGGALAAFCSQRTATSRARARGVLEGGDQQRHYADSQMINVVSLADSAAGKTKSAQTRNDSALGSEGEGGDSLQRLSFAGGTTLRPAQTQWSPTGAKSFGISEEESREDLWPPQPKFKRKKTFFF